MSGYDGDVCTYDPQGKVFQIQYAQESPKLGAPVVGITNDQFGILLSIRRSPSKLAQYQPKTFKITSTIGCGASGIYADVRKMLKHSRTSCIEYQENFNEQQPIKQLVVEIQDEAQQRTQYGGLRPFGAALLILGTENNKPCLYVTDPNAEYYKFKAHTVGKNSQAVNAYITSHYAETQNASIQQLCFLALKAMRQASFIEYEAASVEVAVLENGLFKQLQQNEVRQIVDQFLIQNPIVKDNEEDS